MIAKPTAKPRPHERPVELLAPAGGLDAALAAFEFGADAIYLGLRKFSARADADNFDAEGLAQIVGHAHGLPRPRRVFVAVNTLALDDELPELVATLGAVAESGADAVIVQDLGAAAIVRRHFPRLRLHSSTQLAIHDRAGVEALARLGFARVTLARELTLEEVRDCASVPGIEVETFLHGALCYAYSGLCLLSSQLIDGRSGNRGACAYPCRDEWTARGAPGRRKGGAPAPREPGKGFAFSMKDLALPDLVSDLRSAGVSSLKIEGRKKGPLYVAATVGYYRALLDGGLAPKERAEREADIQSIFSRPWTGLYLRSRRNQDVADPDTVGHRGAPAGKVEAVARYGRSVYLRFQSARPLALHDGLQIDLPTQGRPFGFAVDELRLAPQARGDRPRPVIEAPAGSTVEVLLPDGYPTIPEGAPVYCSSSQAVKLRYRHHPPNLRGARTRLPLDVRASLSPQGIALSAEVEPLAGERLRASASVGAELSPARDAAKTADAIRGALSKLGDTRLELRKLEIENPAGLFAPVSLLNEARRLLAADAEAKLAEAAARHVEQVVRALDVRPAPPPAEERWSLKVDRVASLSALEDSDLAGLAEVVVDIGREPSSALQPAVERLAARLGRERVRLALPMIARAWEHGALRAKIERLREAGFTRWEAANLSAWTRLGLDPGQGSGGLDLTADWPVYVLNRAAAGALEDLGARGFTLSPEDGLANMRRLAAAFADRATVAVYQDTPLFVSEACPYASLSGGCPGPADCAYERMDLRSSHGLDAIAINDHCRAVVISREPFSLAGKLDALRASGLRRFRADFVWRPYEPVQLRELWRRIRAGEDVGGHLANFERGFPRKG